MCSLKAVFWDVDGTLSDTELDGHRIAFNEAFKKFDLNWNWSREKYIELLDIPGGINRIKHYALLYNLDISENTIKQIHLYKTEAYMSLVNKGLLKLRPGVARLVEQLYVNNIKQYIVTTSSKKSVIALISKVFKEYKNPFIDIISSSDVLNQKPHPEPYINAINLAEVEAKEIIVIEDSVAGLTSATLASLNCLITLTDWNNSNINDFSNATSIVSSLGDVSSPCRLIMGKPLPSAFVDINYLNSLLKF